MPGPTIINPCSIFPKPTKNQVKFTSVYSFSNYNQKDNSKYVNLNLNILKTINSKFLLDTGADISIIKKEFIKGETVCDPETKVQIKGITTENVETLAICNAFIELPDNFKIQHKFHIVNDEFPILCTGILGKDFLEKFKCSIDYETKSLLIKPLPNIKFNIALTSLFPKIEIPPRVEKVFEVPLSAIENSEVLIEAKILQDGVFLGNSISNVSNSHVKICILNSNDYSVNLDPFELNVQNIENFNMFLAKDSNHYVEVENRFSKLESLLDLECLNQEEKSSIIYLCREFNDIFHLPGDKLSITSAGMHEIPIKSDEKIVNQKPYRLPYTAKIEIERQVKEMLDDGTIENSYSPWNSPLLVVPKKSSTTDKAWRVVVDFRRLNDITIGDVYPLPNIVDILDQLGKSNYFSTLDLADGYHQVPLVDCDKNKTAFSTQSGHYHFTRMPFGLKGAPATFQRIMNNVLSGLTGIKCFVYMDDIVVYGYDLNEHNQRLHEIFSRFRYFNLKLKPQKCHFLRKEIAYLGHIITRQGIKPDNSKIEAVQKFPRPQTVTDVKSFLGLCSYYRRFIANFSYVSEPMIKLTRKSVKFHWDAFCEEAFIKLKSLLCSAPILIYPDFNKPFIVTTDASNYAIGAILSQENGSVDLPIAYASRVLNQAERNYSTSEKELLAIIWAVKRFRPYIYGTKFVIKTDHGPLVWLYKSSNPTSRIMRWRLLMDEYEYEILHKSGKANTNADALSRIIIPSDDSQSNDVKVVTRARAKSQNSLPSPIQNSSTNNCNSSDPLQPSISTSNQNLNSQNPQNLSSSNPIPIVSIIDENQIKKVLEEFHYSPVGAHQGIQRTFRRLKQYYYFPKMLTRVKKFVKSCKSCQINKHTLKNKCKMIITTTAKRPFEQIFLDIVGPLPVSYDGNKYILTIQDNLTKYSIAVPIPNQEADTIAKVFSEHFVCRYGVPLAILTDQGSNLMSEVFRNVCKIFHIKKLNATTYHPETNGALERSHRTLGEYLRNYSTNNSFNWDHWIKFAMFAYNSTPHSSTEYMPFELVFGFKPAIPSSFNNSPEPLYNYSDYSFELKNKLQVTWEIARQNLISKKEKSKQYYDRTSRSENFKVGDKVLLKNPSKTKSKLEPLWFGPYEIIRINSPVNTTIRCERKNKIVHNNLLKKFIE